MELEPTYHLEGIIHSKEEMEDFEGPLNVILMLLSKNKIEIRDIQISVILEQYLAYLDEMKAMDLEIASEFVQMASHLLYIKTRTLLASDEEAVDELQLLISSLEQIKARDAYTAVKEVCPALLRASEQGMLFHAKQPEQLPMMREYRYQHEPWELLQSMADVLRRSRTALDEQSEQQSVRRRIVPKRIVYNVREKSREILRRLCACGQLTLRDFYAASRSRSEVVATFVSVLELCSLGHIRLTKQGDELQVRYVGEENIEKIIESIGE